MPFAAFWADSVNGVTMLQCVRPKSAKNGHSANVIGSAAGSRRAANEPVNTTAAPAAILDILIKVSAHYLLGA